MKRIEICKAGKVTDRHGREFDLSETVLAAVAQRYDPEAHEAPIVVGHPKTDNPAYGWVKSLAFSEGRLSAEPHQVDAQFAEMVKAGRFKKISASFYLSEQPTNPKPGALYLRHVGFLGAEPPAVKGLRSPADLAEGDEGVVEFFADFAEAPAGVVARLFRGLRELVIEKFGQDAANSALPDWSIQGLADAEAADAVPQAMFSEPEGDPMDEKAKTELEDRERAIATKEAEFAEREAGIVAKETEIQAGERKRLAQESADFVEGLVKAGKVLPRDQAPVTALLASLDPGGAVEFSEGEGDKAVPVTKAPGEVLKGFLTNLPVAVDFSERAGKEKGLAEDDPQAVAKKAQDFQLSEAKAGRTVSITECVAHVTKGK
jgi:hypothetical protein